MTSSSSELAGRSRTSSLGSCPAGLSRDGLLEEFGLLEGLVCSAGRKSRKRYFAPVEAGK